MNVRQAVPADAGEVSSWSRSAAETHRWCSSTIHPVPAEQIASWWSREDIRPLLLLDDRARPVAYGELWLDEGEDEVELARLIVRPDARRRGVGQALVASLLATAATTGLASMVLRVRAENAPARRCYLASGFRELDADTTARWNAGQPEPYVWMQHAPDAP